MRQGLSKQQAKVTKKEKEREKLCDYIVLSYLGCHHFISRHHQKKMTYANDERWTMKSALSMVYQNIIVIVWNVSPSHHLSTSVKCWIFGIVFILTRLKSLPLSNLQVYNNSSFIAIIGIIAEYGFRLIHFMFMFLFWWAKEEFLYSSHNWKSIIQFVTMIISKCSVSEVPE